MRDVLKFECVAQFFPLGEPLNHAAIVGLEELLEDQAGEPLGLGEDLRGEAMGVRRQGLLPPLTLRSPTSSYSDRLTRMTVPDPQKLKARYSLIIRKTRTGPGGGQAHN